MDNDRSPSRPHAVGGGRIYDPLAHFNGRSVALHQVLGLSDFNEPFAAPQPLLDPNGPTASSPLPATSPSTQLRLDSLTTAVDDSIKEGLDDEPSPQRPAVAAAMTHLVGDDFLPQTSPRASDLSRLFSSSKKHRKFDMSPRPSGRKYHPDLLHFKFPRPPSPEEQRNSENNVIIPHEVAAEGELTGPGSHKPNAEDDVLMSKPIGPQTGKSSSFEIYEHGNDIDIHSNRNVERPQFANLNVPYTGFSPRSVNTLNGEQPLLSAPFSLQLPGPTAPRNIVPNLQKLFEQWIHFGHQKSDGLCMLQPREIPIIAITARTMPCISIGSPGKEAEKPTKMFTIAVDYDVEELKMLECEVIPEFAASERSKLNVDRRPYHETSTANPNIWTILFIREKPRIREAHNKGGPSKPEIQNEAEVHASKKRCGVQGPGVEPPVVGEDAQNPWQIVAWPSAHVTNSIEVHGPIQEKGSGERTGKGSHDKPAGRAPLAPRVVQVRQQSPPHSPHAGRVYLKDSRAYAKYKAAAQLHAENYQYFSDGAAQENIGISHSLQRPCSRVNTVAGQVGLEQETSAEISGLSISNNPKANPVCVYEMQRLTCLRFLRGGHLPLLAGTGVDLSYWNSFCEYFSKGEIQLEIISSADSEPVVLSANEKLYSKGAKPPAGSRGGRDKEANGPRKGTKNILASLGLAGRPVDTPIPPSMSVIRAESNHDESESTPPLQRNYTPRDNRHGLPESGTGGSFQFVPHAKNTVDNISLHQRPTTASSRPSLLHNGPEVLIPHANNTVIPQHSRNYPNTRTHALPQNPGHSGNPSERTLATNFLSAKSMVSPAGGNAGQNAPPMRGWQAEMLAALNQDRTPAWTGWTERSMPYQYRSTLMAKVGKEEAEMLLYVQDGQLCGFDERRANRDTKAMVHYNSGVQRRQSEVETLTQEKLLSGRLDEEQERLKRREALTQPFDHMQRIRGGPEWPSETAETSGRPAHTAPPQGFPTHMQSVQPQYQQVNLHPHPMASYGLALPPMGYYGVTNQQAVPGNLYGFPNPQARAEWLLTRDRQQRLAQQQPPAPVASGPMHVLWQSGPRTLTDDQLKAYNEQAKTELDGYEDEIDSEYGDESDESY